MLSIRPIPDELFEPGQPARQLRKAPEKHRIAPPYTDLHRRCAGHYAPCIDVPGDARLRCYLHVVAYRYVAGEAGLPAGHHALPDVRTAGHSNLGRQQRSGSDPAPVRDHDEVVDFRPPPDPSRTDGSSVHRRVRSNLHPVAQFNCPDLGNRQRIAATVWNVPEPIAADDGPGLQGDVVSDSDLLAHHRTRMRRKVVTDDSPRVNGHVRVEPRLPPDPHVFSDDDVRCYRGTFPDLRARCDYRRRVHPRFEPRPPIELFEETHQCKVRLLDTDRRTTVGVVLRAEQDRAGARFGQPTRILGIGDKREFTRPGLVDRRQALDFQLPVPFDTTVDELRQVGYSHGDRLAHA